MNFRQLTAKVRELYLSQNGDIGGIFFEMFLRKWETFLARLSGPTGWQEIALHVDKALDVFCSAHCALQVIGMAQTSGNDDDYIWDATTEILDAVRTVLVDTYHIELPEARVVSMVTEAVEAGVLEASQAPDGTVMVSLPDKRQGNLFET